MANITNFINATLSTSVISFKPGDAPACFEVTVINESEQFASFQLEIKAEGSEPNLGFRWYQLSPEVAAKKPPGDRTQFSVAILDNPIPGFVGTMNLLVRIVSLELRQEERLVVRLAIAAGAALAPIKLTLPVPEFQVQPGEAVTIPAQVINPNHQPVQASLKVLGLPDGWLVDGEEQTLQLKPGGLAEVGFRCQPSPDLQTASQPYPFTMAATQPTVPPIAAHGVLKVAAIGHVAFYCMPLLREIPTDVEPNLQPASLHPANSVAYDLAFENASNVSQQVSVQLQSGKGSLDHLQVIPEQADLLPGTTTTLRLVASHPRPKLGPARTVPIGVTPVLSDRRLDLHTDDETLELRVLPVVPLWLQVLGGLLGLALLGWLVFHRPEGHTAAVNSVQFSGNANQVISGSNDQTIRRWRVNDDRLEPDGILAQTAHKAVRVVRYRPIDNNVVAAGLENGEIELWNVLPGGVHQPSQKPVVSLSSEKADRVLSLAFTRDSQFLFSGHGSGMVLQWDLDAPARPVRDRAVQFAISDLALVGRDKLLAIAGRYNRLVLWNWTSNQLYPLAYPSGDQTTYIQSLATTDRPTSLLATADSQGTLSLWDLRQCVTKLQPGCEQRLDHWQGHGGKPVRAIALSANGCYLASVGDDGRTMLWSLAQGKRDTDSPDFNGRELGRVATKLNSVSLTAGAGAVRVISGDEANQVRFYRLQENRSECQ